MFAFLTPVSPDALLSRLIQLPPVVITAIVVAMVALLNTGNSQAAASRLPASFYPQGAHISFNPVLSNREMDCLWGFICDGSSSASIPNFHSFPEDAFSRTGGWGQFAGLRRHGRMVMAFELFASQYAPGVDDNGIRWSAAAYADIQLILSVRRFHGLHGAPRLLSGDTSGEWLAEIQPCGDADLVVMAAWTRDQETEAIVSFDHGSATARATAVTMLAAQVRRSLGE